MDMVNKVILVGNVGGDPEIRFAQNGSKIATFSLATTETWKDRASGERKSLTQWHRIVVFNENLSTVVENYVKKGSKLYIEGSIQNRKYTGNDAVERSITEVIIGQFRGEIQMLDSKGFDSHPNSETSKKATSNNSNNQDSYSNIGDELDDEIPF